VKGEFVAKPFSAEAEPVAAGALAPGRVAGQGGLLVVPAGANAAYRLANRVLAAGGEVRRARAKFKAGGQELEPGAFLISGARPAVEAFARESGLEVPAVEAVEVERSSPLKPRRIALYKPWVANIDEGWTRFLLEQYEFPFKNVTDADIRQGRLAGAYDVVLLPDATVKSLLDGHAPGTVPQEYTGGLGLEGALALKEFVRQGGTLVALESASELATDLFSLGVRNVLKGVPRQDYYCPGSLLRLKVDPAHPLTYGLPAETVVFAENGPAFDEEGAADDEGEEQAETPASDRLQVRFPAHFVEKDVLHSGWLLGESKIAKKAALAEVRLGQGRVVLIAFRPQFRAQPYGTFKVLFNALMLAD
ncbi:MAG TPA: peptidase M14, partial [Vicinamibacteria bacterium]